MKSPHLIVVLFVAALIAYPLSIGPVMRIQAMRHPGTAGQAAKIYSPIVRLCEGRPKLFDALDGYVSLWLRGTVRPRDNDEMGVE